jgi:uncharacterized NAD(P)/FAD-binding protein YdhS
VSFRHRSSDPPSRAEIAIVGGGFSGSMVAVHLLRLLRSGAHAQTRGTRISLYEPGLPGRGHAYSTPSPIHWLNVRAAAMSAFADDPDHFLNWARAWKSSIQGETFVPRGTYGEYISEILAHEREASPGVLEIIQDEVFDAEEKKDVFRIRGRSGKTFDATHLILATGHPLPAPPVELSRAVIESGRYEQDPWTGHPLDAIETGSGPRGATGQILLLGSGLTAIDVLLESRRRGFQGTVHVLSRRGLLPLAHGSDARQGLGTPAEIGEGNIRRMMRALREAVRAGGPDADWRPLFDSLRPRTQAIWSALPVAEKRRFLRHARPYWEIHRHRVAPEIAEQVRNELESGGAILHAARVLSIDELPGALRVTIRPRGSNERRELTVGRVINCTGPNTGIEMCESELTRSLLEKGLRRADQVGIGLACDDEGAVVDAEGRVSERLFTLGPLRKGELWESTAVPEIRVQAERVARRIIVTT